VAFKDLVNSLIRELIELKLSVLNSAAEVEVMSSAEPAVSEVIAKEYSTQYTPSELSNS